MALAAVTAVGFATSLRVESRALAVLATLGGLLTPVILHTDTDDATALFAYLVILDVGVLVVAFLRGVAGARSPRLRRDPDPLLELARSLVRGRTAPHGPRVGHDVLRDLRSLGLAGLRIPRLAGKVELARSLVILGAPAVYFAVARRVLDDLPSRRLATLALVLAALYFVAARLATRSAGGGPRVALLHSAVSLAFLTLAPAVTLGRHDLVVAWSVEGLALLYGGFALSAPMLRAGGLAISALAWGRWFAALGEDHGRAGTFLVAHPALLATVAVVVTAALGALVYRVRERAATPCARERIARPSLLLVAVGSVALLLTEELGQFRTLAIAPPYVPFIKSVVWMRAGARRRRRVAGPDWPSAAPR